MLISYLLDYPVCPQCWECVINYNLSLSILNILPPTYSTTY